MTSGWLAGASASRGRINSWNLHVLLNTLMDSALNVAAANAPFDEKKAFYADSNIEITRSLSELPEWTLERIETRQNELAEKAVLVWPLTP